MSPSADIDYSEAVEVLTALGVISGYDTDNDGVGDTFKPDGNITRAELCVLISYVVSNSRSQTPLYSDINKLNSDYKSLCTFADSKNHWAAGFIAFCATNGYISGHNANTFDPDGSITGAQVATILLRAMGYNATAEKMGTVGGTAEAANTLRLASSAGLNKGMPTNYNFFAAITRQEAAQMILNMLNGNPVQYDNGGFNMTVTGSDGSTTTITSNSKREYVTKIAADGQTVVLATMWDYCFRGVLKDTAAVVNGVGGYRWYLDNNGDGTYTANVDTYISSLVATDKVVGTFEAGTALADITKAKVNINGTVVETYINGTKLTSNGTQDIATRFAAGIPDNTSLTVVNVTGGYKLIVTTEVVAKLTEIASRPETTGTYAGLYKYTFKTGADSNQAVAVTYAASGAYARNAYYVVEQAYTAAGTADTAAVAVNVKAATVVTGLKATSASSASINTAGGYFYVGTTKYEVADNAFTVGTAPTYTSAFSVVLNSAGFVAAFIENATVPSNYETGYVYVDKNEFQVTTSGGSLIGGTGYAWSIVAKARAYFPNAATATLIDLKTEVERNADGTVKSVKVNGKPLSPEQIKNSGIYSFEDMAAGFYQYTKYDDGTYALTAVGASANKTPSGGRIDGALITSATTAQVYTWTGSSVAMASYTGSSLPTVAYDVVKKDGTGAVATAVYKFSTVNAADGTYAYYVKAGDYDASGKQAAVFMINGETVSYTLGDGLSVSDFTAGKVYTLTVGTDGKVTAKSEVTAAKTFKVTGTGAGWITVNENTATTYLLADSVPVSVVDQTASEVIYVDDYVTFVADGTSIVAIFNHGTNNPNA